MRLKLVVVLVGTLFACPAFAVRFDVAEPIWTTAEKGEINSTIAFTTHFFHIIEEHLAAVVDKHEYQRDNLQGSRRQVPGRHAATAGSIRQPGILGKGH